MRPKRPSTASTNAQPHPLTSTNDDCLTILTFWKIEDSRATPRAHIRNTYWLHRRSLLNLSYVLKSEVCAPGGVNALVVVLKLGPSK